MNIGSYQSGEGIKSIQRGVTTMAAVTSDIPITAIIPSKTFISLNWTAAVNTFLMKPVGYFFNTTTLRLIRSEAGAGETYVAWEIVEFK